MATVSTRILVLTMATALMPAAAVASEPSSTAVSNSGHEMTATLTPFSGWLSGVSGTVGGASSSVDVDLTPIDIIENIDEFIDVIDGIYIGWGEFRYRRFGLFFDIYHLNVSSTQSIDQGIITANVDLAFRQTTATFAGTYRLWNNMHGHLDAMAGVRVNDIDIGIALGVGILNPSLNRGDNWTDAIVGMKGQYAIDPKWSLTGWALIGGGSSDITWDLYGAVTYSVRPGFDMSVGFRGLKIDYSSSDFTWDVLQYGPVLNATFKF